MKPSAPALFVTLVTLSLGLARAQVIPPTDAPILTFPANAAPSVPLDASGGMTLDWEDVATADLYEVQLESPPSGFVIPISLPPGDSTSKYVTNLTKGALYAWRVRARNAAGPGPWSTTHTFTPEPLLTPNLVSPSPNALGLPSKPTITFSWLDNNPPLPPIGPPVIPPLPGMAYVYQLQVATDASFPALPPPSPPGVPPTPPYIVDLTFSDPPFTFLHDTAVSGFTYGKTYYWRVKTTLGSGTSVWSPIRSFTTALPPPTTITLVYPAPTAVDVPVLPVLQWDDSNRPSYSPMPGIPSIPPIPSPYWVRVATDSTFPDVMPMPPGMGLPPTPPYVINELVSDTSLTLTQPLNRSQKYYWRVMVQEAYGGNGSYASGSFTVMPDPPDLPSLTSPAPEAVDVPLTEPLTWSAAARASTYKVSLGTDSTFTDTMQYQRFTTSATSLPGNLTPATRYFWRVSAENAAGSSGYAPTRAFNTVPPVPLAPTLVSPRQDSSNTYDLMTLTWSNIGGVTYHIQLATDLGFADLVEADSGLGGISALLEWNTLILTKGTSYYWRVRGKNAGGPGPWSKIYRFTVIPPLPTIPVLANPGSGAPNVPLSPNLVWLKSPFAATYSMQVATDPTFNTPLTTQTGLTDTSTAIGPLSRSQTYYWRVSAKNAAGVCDWGGPFTFTTVPEAPGAPNLVAPAADAENLSALFWLEIAAAAGAATYDYQLAVDSTFSTRVLDDSGFTALQHPVPSLVSETRYWWRARARNPGGIGPWSTVRTFTTAPSLPSAVSLVYPKDGDTLTGDSLTGRWHPAGQMAFRYRVQVSQDSAFTSPVTDSLVFDTLKVIHYAAGNGRYWWRVQAFNPAGWGPYSQPRWFLVANPVTSLAKGLRFAPGSGGRSSLLHYALADASRVTLSLFDLHGRERARPVDGWQPAGPHAVDLEAVDRQGRRLTRGWYLLRLEAKPTATTTATGHPTLRHQAPIFLGP